MRGAGKGVEGGKGIPTTNRFELLSQMEDLPVSQEGEKKNSPRAHDKGETKRSLEQGSPQGGNVATSNRFQPLSGNAAHPQGRKKGQKQKATRAQGKGKARHGGGRPRSPRSADNSCRSRKKGTTQTTPAQKGGNARPRPELPEKRAKPRPDARPQSHARRRNGSVGISRGTMEPRSRSWASDIHAGEQHPRRSSSLPPPQRHVSWLWPSTQQDNLTSRQRPLTGADAARYARGLHV